MLIRRMAEENSAWGAPKVHGELLKLGFVHRRRCGINPVAYLESARMG